MTIKMIALRRFRYPTGPEGREYDVGDEVEIQQEKHATALRLTGRVKDIPVQTLEPEPKPTPKAEPEVVRHQEKKEERFEHRASRLFGERGDD